MKNLYLFLLFIISSNIVSAQIESLPSFGWENFDMPPSLINKFVESNGRLWAINGNVYYYEEEEQKWIRKSEFIYSDMDNIVAADFGVAVSRSRTIASPWTHSIGLRSSWRTNNENTNFGVLRSFNTVSGSFNSIVSSGLIRKSANEIIELGWSASSNNDMVLKSYSSNTAWSDYPVNLGVGTTMKGLIISQDTFIIKYTTATDSLHFLFFTDDYNNPYIVAIDSVISDLSINNLNYKQGRLMGVKNGKLFHSSDFGENWQITDYNQILDTTNVSSQNIKIKEDFLEIRRDGEIWKVNYDNLTEAELVFETDIPFYDYKLTESFYILKTDIGTYLRRHDENDFVYQNIGLTKDISHLLAADSTIYANSINTFKLLSGNTDLGVQEEFELDNAQFLTAINGVYFRGEENAIYKSNNQGVTWELYTSLSNEVNKISTNNGAFFYSDSTLLFTANGLDFSTGTRPGSEEIYGNETKLITFDGLTRYISTDMGQSWLSSEIDSIMPGNIIYTAGGLTSIQLASANPWQSTPGEVFRSENDGTSWEKVNEISVLNGYDNSNSSGGGSLKYLRGRYLTHNQDLMFLAMNRKVVVSNDGGYTYYFLPVPFSSQFIGWNDTGGNHTYSSLSIPKGFVIDNDMLIAYTTDQGIFRTSLSGINQLIEDFEAFTKQISGKAFIDENNNCLFDEGEIPITNQLILFDEHIVFTDTEGDYSIELSAQGDAYVIDTEDIEFHYLACLSDDQEIQVIYGSEAEIQDFPFQPFEVLMDTLHQEVCIGEEWEGNIITQDTMWIDSLITTTQILLTVFDASILPNSENEVFYSGNEFLFVDGVLYLEDTIFTEIYENYLGCDSTIIYTLDILSSIKSLDSQRISTILSPNPTQGKMVLNINSVKSEEINVNILTVGGEFISKPVKNRRIQIGENNFDLDTSLLPLGVYYLDIQIQSRKTHYLKFIKT